MARIFIATEHKNEYLPMVYDALRKYGHQVYDYQNSPSQEFSWNMIDPYHKNWGIDSLKNALVHPYAEKAFNKDFECMQKADLCILITPCGLSAHAVAGWMKGAGKKVLVFQPWPQAPELMYKMFDGMYSMLTILLEAIDDLKLSK